MEVSCSGSGSRLTLILKFGMVHMSGIYKGTSLGCTCPQALLECVKRGRQTGRHIGASLIEKKSLLNLIVKYLLLLQS